MAQNGKAEPQRCGNCRFAAFDIRNTHAVQCRQKPPLMFMLGVSQPRMPGMPPSPIFVTEFPAVKREHWCGSWEKRTQMQQQEDSLPAMQKGGETMPIPQLRKVPPPDESMEG